MSNIIEVKNLCKSYNDIQAVKGINFSVKKGSFFAFLGENGAGKSTTINIISTLLNKSSGEVFVNHNQVGSHDDLIRRDIGVVFQGNMLDKHLTVKENLLNRGRLYGLTKKEITDRLLKLSQKIGVKDILYRLYGKLSGGQKRRADILRALINYPKILILDEPTTGLDPYTRKYVWETIHQLKDEQHLTIFLTTHYMEEAACADYVVIMDSGQIKAEGTPDNLKLKYSTDRLNIITDDISNVSNILKTMDYSYKISSDKISVTLDSCFDAIEIVNQLKEKIKSFEVLRGNMEDVFINVTGRTNQSNEVIHDE